MSSGAADDGRRAALSGAHEGLLEAGARRVEGTVGKLDGLVEPAGEPQNEMLTAAIASPSRVCAFSRTRSLSSSAWKAARSMAAGRLGALVAWAPGR